MTKEIEYPEDVKEIYRRWGEGPTPDQYYNAVAAYFEAQARSASHRNQKGHSE